MRRKAVINMRQHRLSLCKEHFLEWLPNQVERFINKYKMFSKKDRVLVAVSGGKDSLALWDILWKLGYQTEGVYIHLGIDEGIEYSENSLTSCKQFTAERDLELHVSDLRRDYGESITEINQRTHRGRTKPCSSCGLVKRYILNHFAVSQDFDVLATAHNLDDEAAILLANTLDWSLSFLARGTPVLAEKPGFAKKVKPLCRTYERESAAYAILRNISYEKDECPFSVDSKQLFYKKYLNEWDEEHPGTKLRFYLKYLSAITKGAFPDRQEAPEALTRHLCPSCGQPTITGGLCAFCRLFQDQIIQD